MGSSISGILAILFMDKLETIALSSHLMISPYKRYVDNICLQTTNEETADHFHDVINNVHPNLKFEIEKPEIASSGLSLSLLNFKVTISKDGNSSFEFYKKTSRETTTVCICPPSISYANQIQTQLHSQRAKTHQGQMLLKYICKTTPKHMRLHPSPQRLSKDQNRADKMPIKSSTKPPTWQHRMVIS